MPRTTLLTYALLGLGLIQMLGDLSGIAALKGLGAASGLSPAPKVFSAVEGLETFSSRFIIEWKSSDGEVHSHSLTPELYAKIQGPYNRRNVYGAAISYGPVLQTKDLSQDMFFAVSRFAFCDKAPLLEELGFDTFSLQYPVILRVIPKSTTTPAPGLKFEHKEHCAS